MLSKNIDYLPRIDHLRFFAFFLVFAFHLYHLFYRHWTANPEAAPLGFIVEGHTGVALFFVLSGFLFMLIGLQGEIDYGNFLYNRFLRIFPLFTVIFFVAASLGRDDFQATDILYLFFSNIGHPPTSDFFVTGAAWTISVEFTFYLIFPFICRFFLSAGYGYMFGLLSLLLLFKLCAYFATDNPIHVLYSTLIGRLDQFLIGMMAARFYSECRERLSQVAVPMMLCAALWMYGWLWYLAAHASLMSPDKHQPLWIIWSGIEAVGWASVILTYLSLPIRGNAVVARVVGYCGKISFSLYLLHGVVLFLVEKLVGVINPTPWLALNYLFNVLWVLGLSVLVATVSFRCIESPFLQLRRRYLH